MAMVHRDVLLVMNAGGMENLVPVVAKRVQLLLLPMHDRRERSSFGGYQTGSRYPAAAATIS